VAVVPVTLWLGCFLLQPGIAGAHEKGGVEGEVDWSTTGSGLRKPRTSTGGSWTESARLVRTSPRTAIPATFDGLGV
jgi:hypothetical protein